jgi:hypothetical protein
MIQQLMYIIQDHTTPYNNSHGGRIPRRQHSATYFPRCQLLATEFLGIKSNDIYTGYVRRCQPLATDFSRSQLLATEFLGIKSNYIYTGYFLRCQLLATDFLGTNTWRQSPNIIHLIYTRFKTGCLEPGRGNFCN